MSPRRVRRPARELVALRIEATVLAGAILFAVEVGQLILARVEVVGLHIFCGVLFVVLATLLTSYLFRPGFVPAAGRG